MTVHGTTEAAIQEARTERVNRMLGAMSSSVLSGSTAVIVGCGVLGGAIAEHCTRLGFGRLVLADPQRVEPENLSNQCFRVDDLGRLKVDAAASHLAAVNPCVKVTRVPRLVQRTGLATWLGANIMFICTDSFGSRQYTARIAQLLSVDVINAAVDGEGGLRGIVQAFPSARAGACYSCQFSGTEVNGNKRQKCPSWWALQEDSELEELPTLSSSAHAAMLSGYAVVEGLRLLRKGLDHARETRFDIDHGSMETVALSRNPRCRHECIEREFLDLGEGRALTLGDTFREAEAALDSTDVALRLHFRHFLTVSTCVGCGREIEVGRIVENIREGEFVCSCESQVSPSPWGLYSRASRADVEPFMKLTWAEAGLSNDIITAESADGRTVNFIVR